MATNERAKSTAAKHRARNAPSPKQAFAAMARRAVADVGVNASRPPASARKRKRGAAAAAPAPAAPIATDAARAVALGAAQADFVLRERAKKRAARERAIAWTRRARGRGRKTAKSFRRKSSAPGAGLGLLVAEGDSWFDYPFCDVLDALEDEFGWDVETVAHKGDTAESMAYDGGQLDDLVRAIERVVRRGQSPHAILLSGGGNDVAGDAFATFLHPRNGPVTGLDDAMVASMVDTRLRLAYLTMLAAITSACDALVGTRVPIVVHGYDYPVPDGRGFWSGFGPLPGPWLAPGFELRGYDDLGERIVLAAQIIDRFNAMLAGVVALPEFAHVRLVPVRGTLSTVLAGNAYRDWWQDEMHPSHDGFVAVARRFHALL